MAIRGKLIKLKSVLKRLPSFNNKTAATRRVDVSVTSAAVSDETTANLRPVYVGKSRRRYLINSDMIDHPLFKQLSDRSPRGDDDVTINVSCEVVLFEHLLWMLENADPQPESLSELVEFYAC